MPSSEENPLSKKLGLKEEPVKTSANIDNYNGTNGEKDYLKLLEITLLMPALSLIKMYLMQANGTRKTTENCIMEFREDHPHLFAGAFVIDFFFRFFYIAIVIIVTIRGLGIDQYFINLFPNK